MVEWSITVVLKTTVLRGTGGSNPSLSANIFKGSHNDSLFLYYQNKWNDRDKKSD